MNLPLLVEAEALASELNNKNLIVVDLSSSENYNEGHIPGAIHLDSSRLLRGEGPIANKLPSEQQLEMLVQDLGLREESWLVAYDDQKGPWAGRLIWTLHCMGYQNCSALNGQLNSWKAADLPLEQSANDAATANFTPLFTDRYLIDADTIISQQQQPNQVIWDARSPEEYRGEKIINAQKGGHIPAAVNFEWTDCLRSTQDLRLKERNDLLAALEKQGITPDKTVITHCQTHRRSGLTYLVARHLGFEDVRCYDGSWFEWGNRTDTPVEK